MPKYLVMMAEIPEDVGILEAKQYCWQALRYWGGQRHPSDPLFDGMKVGIKTHKPGNLYKVENDAETISSGRASRRVQNKGRSNRRVLRKKPRLRSTQS